MRKAIAGGQIGYYRGLFPIHGTATNCASRKSKYRRTARPGCLVVALDDEQDDMVWVCFYDIAPRTTPNFDAHIGAKHFEQVDVVTSEMLNSIPEYYFCLRERYIQYQLA
jgi:hypothetical protein